MTNTTFGKKLLLIATITVLVSGLTIATSMNDAEAKKNPPTGTHDLKCKESIGSFFSPDDTAGLLFSSAEGKCKFTGHTAFASITTITGVGTSTNCITLATPEDVDSYGIGKKGSYFTFSMELEQCFFEADGLTPTTAFTTDDFCDVTVSTDAFISTVTGTYEITGGQINDKKHGNTSIISGSGIITSSVDHCAGSTAPYGNSVVTEMTGTIVFP